jgi:hypothetical protein
MSRAPSESDIEKYFVIRSKNIGALVRKLQWIGRIGAPDRFFAFNGNIVLVELKAPGCRPRSEQEREHTRLTEQGVRVEVLSTKEEIDLFINSFNII